MSAAFFDAPRRGACPQVTSSTATAVPLPLKGKDNCALLVGLDFECRAVIHSLVEVCTRYNEIVKTGGRKERIG